jgi:hypothetical protein
MKSIVTAILLALALSACAGLADSSRGSTASPSKTANTDYPYNPAY